ncbi:MAG: hypothetical protein J6K88_02455 [Oscillospiraceae bacterium]|nr:hypothetical protein [Oscillospiraceae bacterium]
MTLREVFGAVEKLRPEYLTEKEKFRAISRLECLLSENGEFRGFQEETEALSLPEEFSDLYILYLKAEAENKLEEYERCNNTLAAFSAELDNYLRYRRRNAGFKKSRFRFL